MTNDEKLQVTKIDKWWKMTSYKKWKVMWSFKSEVKKSDNWKKVISDENLQVTKGGMW